jgi:hypothetical protein
MHGLHENGMQTATVTDMGGSENPDALYVHPYGIQSGHKISHTFSNEQ